MSLGIYGCLQIVTIVFGVTVACMNMYIGAYRQRTFFSPRPYLCASLTINSSRKRGRDRERQGERETVEKKRERERDREKER